MKYETKLFLHPVRYQMPIGTRCDTYSAVAAVDLNEHYPAGTRIAVKGPYKSGDAAVKPWYVSEIRKLLSASIPGLPHFSQPLLVLAIPDQFADTRPQRMTQMKMDKPAYFFITPDLTAPHVLPTKLREPSKNFPKGCEVVDWEKLEATGYRAAIPFAATYEDSIYYKDPQAGKWIVYHALINWVFGIGGDLCLRNMIYPAPGIVYKVDDDALGRMEWQLGNEQIARNNQSMGRHFQRKLFELDLTELRNALTSQDVWGMCKNFPWWPIARQRAYLQPDDLRAALVFIPRSEKKASSSAKRQKLK